MAKLYNLTHSTLRQLMDYDPATGLFTWKVARSNRVKPGSRAGVLHRSSGGRYISIGGEKFMAHRLAWFYVHGRWPNTDVRPNDGNYDNCAIDNLIEMSRVELQHARHGNVANNTSGYRGVSRARSDKWQAKITWNYKQFNLGGSFESAEAASEMYEEAFLRIQAAKTREQWNIALEELRVWRGQRTAWRFLQRSHPSHAWPSFEDFCTDVKSIPHMRYAMVAIDATEPIGPGNFRWAFPEGFHRHHDSQLNAEARRANRHHERAKELKKIFGIDSAEYQRILIAQGGVCAICEKPETKIEKGTLRFLSVDHDHTTGAIRGLLCANCNLGLGYFRDRPVTLRSAIAYLDRSTNDVAGGARTSAPSPAPPDLLISRPPPNK